MREEQRALFGKGPGRWDFLVAAALGGIYLVLIMSTSSMGYTRDETFYFHHSKVYLNWMLKVQRAETDEERQRLLSKEEVKKTWRSNFEHPPLTKVLFGQSWRHLGKKRRPVMVLKSGELSVSKLGYAHGFEVGDEALLLSPVPPGGDPSSDSRVVGTVEILSRSDRSAKAAVAEGGPSIDELRELCDLSAERKDGVFHQTGCEVQTDEPLQVLSESSAFRFVGAAFGALLIALMYLLSLHFTGRYAAILAAAMLAFVPRLFFHAHLTCFDIPITALTLAVLYAFFRSLTSTGWAVATAVLWGLALLTKLNSFFIPITLLLWWAIAHARQLRFEGRFKLSLPGFPLAFVLMPAIGLPMLFIFWPWLWYDSIASFGKYLGFHLHHEHYFQYYFGRAYQSPPFPMDLPLVLTLFTVPVVTIVLFLIGVGRVLVRPIWQRRGEGAGETDTTFSRAVFIVVNLVFPIALISMPSTPVFGGVKHWLLTMPFFCLLAGIGCAWVFKLGWKGLVGLGVADRAWVWSAAAALAAIVVVAPAARDTIEFHRYGTAYYNELIGGARGAADVRLQRQFWSYANRGALEYVNRTAPYGATVDFQDALPGACDMYRLEGLIRHDLKCVVRRPAPDFVLFDVEERFTEEEQRYWDRMHTLGPVFEAGIDGVPMLRVYRKNAGAEFMKRELEPEGPAAPEGKDD